MVSVVIVTYNASETLQRCLSSVYDQVAANQLQVIVVDGESTDHTVSILEENSSRIAYWISERDNGIYDAMNKGLSKVTTPWVYFLGADDELLPEFSDFIQVLKNPSSVYYANVLYKGGKHSGLISPYRQAKLGIFHQSIIYPSAIFKKYQYNIQYKIAADYALNMQLHKDPNYHFEYQDFTIARYNDTGISATVVDEAFEKDKFKLIFKNFELGIVLRYWFRQAKQSFKNG